MESAASLCLSASIKRFWNTPSFLHKIKIYQLLESTKLRVTRICHLAMTSYEGSEVHLLHFHINLSGYSSVTQYQQVERSSIVTTLIDYL